METKTKKTTMIGAALAVAIIAMAGVGYAVTHTAITSNSNNKLEATYVELSQSGAAAYDISSFLTEVYFNTEDTSTVAGTGAQAEITNSFKYTVVNDYVYDATAKTYTPVSGNTPGNCALAGTGLILTANTEGTAPAGVRLAVQAGGNFVRDSNLAYTLIISTSAPTNGVISVADTATLDANNTWTFNSLSLSQDATWNLYLFVSGYTTANPSTGFAANGVTFTFTLTANPST